jgi:predicted DNA-binding transcriptional regulator AlpA
MITTRQAAKKLGIGAKTLSNYIAVKKVPAPQVIKLGKFVVHAWTEAEIEHVRQLLPKIANGRKTRYSKLREKQKAQPKKAAPRKPKKKK